MYVPPSEALKAIILSSKNFSSLAKEEGVDFLMFQEVWDAVKKDYVKQPIDESRLFYGALEGIVSSLDDPYSVFLDPELSQIFESDLSGEFEGIGAEIGIRKDQLVILAPLANTPASRSGLLAGDAILFIDDIDTFDMSLDEAVARIRGAQGTQVKLTIFRESESETRDITITRDRIHVDSLTWRFDDERGIAVIQLNQFLEVTEQELHTALNELLLKEPRGIILDLRNNPGGFLLTAIQVTSQFIPEDQLVVEEHFSDGSVQEYRSENAQPILDIPMIVLVNEGSASASEIVAGALQDYKRAKVIGEKTFGKGSVQDFRKFPDGSTLKLTVAEWTTPNSRSITDQGITPDIVVELTTEDINNNLDPQYDKAVEDLLQQLGS
ncbi:MAG: hypothetical protein A3B74_01625 [Candidatus Kerfeldbacteria bacterium RIFCSPHIGHO2_02_FULL_42_14]|uniref:PDZ domain-containing protein n=1 Tax=Candidatus Kerfeldbacteria bacterium RIFCSPHIGHO2_02_FULL_42_14 TaxID=1798540 RepID=A0A1G2ASQ3_9BACT|nr:MAG: hypothetical protein A3B74_01625 [Candidatus Kerfeldbacteria bacterium RIFCSPHIGHO2_02_FULL_42_14]OGY82325.1 MAG: hypothetical protein A3E60_03825 [Candidatus Kerfeldbacteria bacterium RIFCSPHIGHO2_12_FULL_42_13]OGY84754.1 MAG: hypothetical protein A3I91_05625 [Candidatus Kerfeldbacteria bacterium RIFCSPLOWO2_02_FULL_42_19]